MDFVTKILRTVFFDIDRIIFSLIDDIYLLLLKLARTTIFNDYTIQQFAKRVYALVGIFMLFKVTISIVNYILNPDDFSDKEKGFGSIVKNIILSLVLMVLVPYIFSEAYELQSIILEENTIMNLVFGTSGDDERYVNTANSTYADSAGKKIQFTILYTFAQPNYDDFMGDDQYDLIDCRNTYKVCDNNTDIGCSAVGEYKRRLKLHSTTEASGYILELNPACFGVYNSETDEYEQGTTDEDEGILYKLFKDSGYSTAYENYAHGVSQKSFSLFWKKDVILARENNGGNRYLIHYRFLFSTVVGAATAYILFLFCIDIAMRSVKLGFLQMIAPIPIISLCDPKSSKDGMFKKWSSTCFKTYIDLFIRLFSLYFGIYVITIIGEFYDVTTMEPVDDWIVQIFMIIGVLMFAKKLPDFLKDALGFDGGTFKDFKLNPLRRLENDMLGGKVLKKPADLLDKVPGAPLRAVGTFNKKLVGGVDAVKNGNSFKTGFSRVHGETYNSIRKTLDEWMPDSAEARKNREKGEKSQEQRKIRENIGNPAATEINDAMDRLASTIHSAVLGRNYRDADEWKKTDYSSYAKAKMAEDIKQFENAEYRASYEALAKAKLALTEKQQEASDLTSKYQAVLNGQTIVVNGTSYSQTNAAELKKLLDGANASASSAQGKVDNAKAMHEDVKLKYGADAEKEKAIDEWTKSHDWTAGTGGHGGSWS